MKRKRIAAAILGRGHGSDHGGLRQQLPIPDSSQSGSAGARYPPLWAAP